MLQVQKIQFFHLKHFVCDIDLATMLHEFCGRLASISMLVLMCDREIIITNDMAELIFLDLLN